MPSAEFNAAAEAVKLLSYKPNNDELLQLYGLFKQATVGDNTTGGLEFLHQAVICIVGV